MIALVLYEDSLGAVQARSSLQSSISLSTTDVAITASSFSEKEFSILGIESFC